MSSIAEVNRLRYDSMNEEEDVGRNSLVGNVARIKVLLEWAASIDDFIKLHRLNFLGDEPDLDLDDEVLQSINEGEKIANRLEIDMKDMRIDD